MGSIRKAIQIAAPAEEIFAYMDDMTGRGHHMLGMGRGFHFEILSANATGVGAEYRWRGSIYGVEYGWTEVVTKWVRNREKSHHSIAGMKIDMGWTLTPKDKGETLVTMTMEYDLGYSLLGKLIDRIWAERYCSDGIDSDFQAMKEILERPLGARRETVEAAR